MNKRTMAIGIGITIFVAIMGFFGSFSISDENRQTMAEIVAPVFNPFSMLGASEQERTDGGFYVLVDETGNVLDQTALRVYKDDEFISADNRRYRVTKIVGDTAQCRFIGREVMDYAEPVLLQVGEADLAVPAAAGKPVVGIYHTHGDESYLPSQGFSSAPVGKKGGITEVAVTLKSELEKKGISVLYNDALHSPHDSGAYNRSRRTATTLMKQGAQVLIDVHRDAVPAEVYRTEVNGQDVSQVKFVVGRRNPAKSASLEYAKRAKGFVDKHYPGLAKGIFIGKGVYNQDLQATNLLVEVGTDKISLDEAKRGVTMLANTLPNLVGGGTAGGAAGGTKQIGKTMAGDGSGKAVGWLIGALVIGALAFLLISTGSVKGAVNKLKHFGSAEWTNYLGRRRTKDILLENKSGLKTKTGPTAQAGFLWEAAREIDPANKSGQSMDSALDQPEFESRRQSKPDQQQINQETNQQSKQQSEQQSNQQSEQQSNQQSEQQSNQQTDRQPS